MRRRRPRGRPRPLALAAALLLLALGAGCGGSGSDEADTARPGPTPEPREGATLPGSEDPEREEPTIPAWREGQVSAAAEGHATLLSVRTGRHDGYDRLVLEFAGGVPGYTARYADRPLHQCGSGLPIEVDAPHTFQVELQSVAAHDEEGNATVTDRARAPGLPVIRSARLTCDFEGVVEWVLGLEARTEFRVFRLEEPTRLVIDLRHP